MILYRPDGDVYNTHIKYRPRTCFIMTKLGQPISSEIKGIRVELSEILRRRQIEEIDAKSIVTGLDFLNKIWNIIIIIIITVPLGIAIIDCDMSKHTLSNIFYEIGFMQACGKETLVIKTKDAEIPSDFIRTEYVEYGNDFKNEMEKFFDDLFERPDNYQIMAEVLENNPFLAIDYLRRAYLITGDAEYRNKAKIVYKNASIDGRAKTNVEALLINF